MSELADQSRILERLQRSSLGLSSREIGRRVKLQPHRVSQLLRELQSKGLVERGGGRWKLVSGAKGRNQPPSQPVKTSVGSRPVSHRTQQGFSPYLPAGRTRGDVSVESPKMIDAQSSRWREFRQLCKYYAECIRLDQKAAIHAKADEELKKIVCLGGPLPGRSEFSLETPATWHEWLKNLHKEQFVFLGYPLNRYEWRDASSGSRVEFISPIFIQPFTYVISGTTLSLSAAGTVRVNEGWLERRLPNIEQRRSFVELCGNLEGWDLSRPGSESPWIEFARLLQHFYPNWCVETLNPRQLSNASALSSISSDGVYNRAGLVLSRAWRFTKRLYKELQELASFTPDEALDKTALVRLFPNSSPTREGRRDVSKTSDAKHSNVIGAQVPSLNYEQTKACEASASERLSIVVGPPGTGKSRVVAAVLTQQAIVGSNALFASRNHRALEAVVPRVGALTEPFSLILRLSRPWEDPVDHSLALAIQELVFSPPSVNQPNLFELRKRLEVGIRNRQESEAKITEIAQNRDQLRTALTRLEGLKAELPSPFNENFSFQNDSPTQDLVEQLLRDLRPKETFSLSKRYFMDLFLLKKRIGDGLLRAESLDWQMRKLYDENCILPKGGAAGSSLEKAEFYCRALRFWLPFLQVNEESQKVQDLVECSSRLPSIQSACEKQLEYSNIVVAQSHELLKELSHVAGAGLSDIDRTLLASVNAAIKNSSGLDSEEDKRRLAYAMRKTFPLFLEHYPLAATTNLSIGRSVPLEPALYDLLVIDEASQCDIASVIPLLFRAKRCMVVGDPMQLNHVTTLSAATDQYLRRQFMLDELEFERFSYRTTSMFNLANTSPVVDARTSLRQHHRCHPAIAEYCNETFYKGGWTVLTDHSAEGGLRWTQVEDDCEPALGGGSISKTQVAEILVELQRLSDAGFAGSVGVVTPFRRQANLIQDRVRKTINSSKLKEWDFHVDTADGFQGDERDIVLFSLVGGAGLKDGARRFLASSPNRFNVAASRAKRLFHVFGDLEWAVKSGVNHISALAELSQEAGTHKKQAFRDDLIGPVWEPRLASALKEAGIAFEQQYPVCGRYLDFALIRPGLKLDVEVDGETYHRDSAGNRLSDDILRDQILIANGWSVLRFWVYELRDDIEGCVEKVKRISES